LPGPAGSLQNPKKMLTHNRAGYTFMSAIHKDRLHSAIARLSVKSCIDDWALALLLMRLECAMFALQRWKRQRVRVVLVRQSMG
jgi:hypothetical protein